MGITLGIELLWKFNIVPLLAWDDKHGCFSFLFFRIWIFSLSIIDELARDDTDEGDED